MSMNLPFTRVCEFLILRKYSYILKQCSKLDVDSEYMRKVSHHAQRFLYRSHSDSECTLFFLKSYSLDPFFPFYSLFNLNLSSTEHEYKAFKTCLPKLLSLLYHKYAWHFCIVWMNPFISCHFIRILVKIVSRHLYNFILLFYVRQLTTVRSVSVSFFLCVCVLFVSILTVSRQVAFLLLFLLPRITWCGCECEWSVCVRCMLLCREHHFTM